MDEIWQSSTQAPILDKCNNIETFSPCEDSRVINVPGYTGLLPLLDLLLSLSHLLSHSDSLYLLFIMFHAFLKHRLGRISIADLSQGLGRSSNTVFDFKNHYITWPEWYPWNLDWGIIGFISQWWRSTILSILTKHVLVVHCTAHTYF